MKTLSPAAARRVYDRIGRLQDSQAFYEDKAIDEIVAHADLNLAHSVFEFGCGTGRFGERLLSRHLPPDATYCATDVSPVMVGLARRRLVPFGERATVRLTTGAPPADEPPAAHDRFFAHFVLDLLSDEQIRAVIAAAHRLLRPDGLLGLSSLAPGFTPASRLFIRVWTRIHSFRPAWVGGCRPLDLASQLPATHWRIRHHARMMSWGVPLAAIVAERLS